MFPRMIRTVLHYSWNKERKQLLFNKVSGSGFWSSPVQSRRPDSFEIRIYSFFIMDDDENIALKKCKCYERKHYFFKVGHFCWQVCKEKTLVDDFLLVFWNLKLRLLVNLWAVEPDSPSSSSQHNWLNCALVHLFLASCLKLHTSMHWPES